VFGEAVILTATVSPAAPGAGTPTGTVTFFDGATPLFTVSLDASGQAAMTTTALVVGSHAITAVYSGDTDFAGSTSPVDTHTVTQAATTTAMTTAPDPSVFGQTVTMTATVSAVAPASGTATGTVSFFDGATLIGTATLSGGVATLTTSTLAVGSHSLTAVYAGDADFAGGTSSVATATVNQASTTTTLSTAPSSTVFGEMTTLTATVAAVAPGAGMPTGTVSFFDGATVIGTVTLSSGTASVTTSALAVGSNTLTAVYNGDADFAGSAASTTQTVAAASTLTVLTPATPAPKVGHAFDLVATVSVVTPGAGVPTGVVTFFDGATPLGTAPVIGGTATLPVTLLGAGNHTITATYIGDANFTASTAAATQSVLAVTGDVNGDGIADTVVGMRTKGSQVAVISGADNSVLKTYTPFGTFKGGVNVALGDINGDGRADVIMAAGPGGKTQVKVMSGADDSVLADFTSYTTSNVSPIRVAAGDVDGDGKDDIITAATHRVKAFSGADQTVVLADLMPFGSDGGGVRVAAGDVDGDGKADIITAAGPGASPNVKVYSGEDASLMFQLKAYPNPTLGLMVAAGDVDGDGKADVIVGHGNKVRVFSGEDRSQLANFAPFTGSTTVSVTVAARDLDGDGHADIITGAPESFGSRVKVFGGDGFADLGEFQPFATTFRGGVNVG
jgi:hypothetical protein